MIKFLLIGSAPYIKEWYKLYGKDFVKNDWKLCAINNAWKVDPENLKIWLHSNDFKAFGEMPKHKDKLGYEAKYREIIAQDPAKDFKPYTYEKKGSGTMLLNALCILLNAAVKNKQKCTVALAGNDCIYTGKNDHFYGKGSPDPVRYGAEWLIGELKRIARFYEQEGCKLINVGGQNKTLLPYAQRKPEQVL